MNIEIANKLQRLRKENGYSQEELADKLGISRQAVSKWERAESSPDTDNLIILAKLYNVSLDELLSTDESIDDIRKETIEKNENKDSIILTDDEGQRVEINGRDITCYDKNGNVVKREQKSKSRRFLDIMDGLIVTFTLLAFFLWSTLANAWWISWVLWVFMPALMSLFEAIVKRKPSKFLYPVFAAGIFCLFGMLYNIWHPLWVVFLGIPAYYTVCGLFEHKKDNDED